MTDSPQMANVKRRYFVHTKAELLKAIQADYERETGERFSLRTIEAILDEMLEAEYQRIEGGAYS